MEPLLKINGYHIISSLASLLSTAYLVAYNVFALIGWSYALYSVALSFLGLYNPQDAVFNVAAIQTTAILEIFHASTGLVKAQVMPTFMQIYSRLFVIWAITWKFELFNVTTRF